MGTKDSKTEQPRTINSVSGCYFDHDVVITEHNEFFFHWEAKKYGLKIKAKANKKESIEYIKEFNYWLKEESENQAAGSCHELCE